MYSRIIGGEEYSFGVSGKLVRNVLVMYDRQTDSLWSQLLGSAIQGPLEGTELEFLPAWQTTWAEWKEMHPDTLALDKDFSGNRDAYDFYYSSTSAGVIGETFQDDRLYTKEFVIGVESDGEAVAFPFSVLNEQPVVNHTVGETRVLVTFNEESTTGVVFDREIDGRELTFEQVDGLTLMDLETGTTWNGQTGEAIEGELAGKNLSRVKSTSSFWFGWKDFYPDTEVYGIE